MFDGVMFEHEHIGGEAFLVSGAGSFKDWGQKLTKLQTCRS